MLRIVTDGAADLPASWKDEFGIQVVPINIHFGEKTFLQNVDLDTDGFYKLVDETHRVPKTSQPSPHQFTEFYRSIAEPGDTIISIHVTSKLSGTYDSAVAAARELVGTFKVIPFDSACGSTGIGFLCREARLLERAGLAVEEIVNRLEKMREKIGVILALDTLEYARLSGRVGTLQAAIASALNVKPIAVLKNGRLEMAERVRTRRASLDRIVQMVKAELGNSLASIAVVHARDPKAGQELMEKVRKEFNIREIFLTDLTISIAANLGPGTVGIIFYAAE
jgi:DegV family protein with EDD domain